MSRKALCITVCVLFITISTLFTAFAENGAEYYDEYDDYYEFEQDYYDTVILPQQQDNKVVWYNELSIIPPIAGLIAGAATLLVLCHKQKTARRQTPQPYAYTGVPNINHTELQNDNTL